MGNNYKDKMPQNQRYTSHIMNIYFVLDLRWLQWSTETNRKWSSVSFVIGKTIRLFQPSKITENIHFATATEKKWKKKKTINGFALVAIKLNK